MALAPRPLAPLRHWSGWLPLAIAAFLVALAIRRVLLDGGVVVQQDEGTEAHLFQLLMPLSLLVSLYFAATWLPRTRVAALVVVAQALAAAAIFAMVWCIDHAGG